MLDAVSGKKLKSKVQVATGDPYFMGQLISALIDECVETTEALKATMSLVAKQQRDIEALKGAQ